MNLHEYQAKAILADYGIPVPQGKIAKTHQDVLAVAQELKEFPYIAKVQVHAGGRGKAGGVKLVHNEQELVDFANNFLGKYLITYQTDHHGQLVNVILIEERSSIVRELYLGMVIDRTSQRLAIMASTEGGMEIEKVAHDTPEKIIHVVLEPLFGLLPFQIKKLASALGLNLSQTKQFATIVTQLVKMFLDKDLSLLEVNPLITTTNGDLVCLDAKMNIDDNALYRHPELSILRDKTQENEREAIAKEWDLNYVSLNGNIGCMVNGAGLAMATMDLIKLMGGEPANFLDVGGGATVERVTKAFEIILSDQHVKAILVNIFGGIVRCDLIAQGIIAAVNQIGIQVPVVVRLEGNNALEAQLLLQNSGLNLIPAASFAEAAKQVVKQVGPA
jgi:succinyl-CoA synthetase beta subunit